ncbi:MAG: toll/interleukin-1 receptor domain-containing protein [Burkholderiaceae bacterium]|nr:toll/interleukin-1 receptor domain-containing protein [Burkholderiaceae bacterium]
MDLDVADDMFWSDLLAYLEERRVVPIVDCGALLVGSGPDVAALDARLAAQLASRLRLDPRLLPTHPRIDDVVRCQRSLPGRRENLYLRLHQLLKDLDLAPPQALRDLASIDAFDLVVCVSFDDLMARAMDEVRHDGEPRTEVVAFAPNRSADLAQPRATALRSTVYHLMGRISSAPDSVICDDDRLEFLHALQDDARRPQLLFDELRDSHLLLLGCRLPDWAARFFLRTARGERLSSPGSVCTEIIVGREAAADTSLVSFLNAFRPSARLLAMDCEDFLAELARRWRDAHPSREAPPLREAAPDARGPRDGAVFISYSRHDRQAAARLADTLQAAGVDIWFDRDELRPGDAWALSILRGIQNCSLFIPVVSQNTQREDRSRAYFWREWNMADDLALGMAPGERFIVPVVIDETDPYGARVPLRFQGSNFTRAVAGEVPAGFVAEIVGMFDAYRRRVQHG